MIDCVKKAYLYKYFYLERFELERLNIEGKKL